MFLPNISAIAQQKPKHCCVILRMATTPLGYLASLRAGISFDFSGNPSWNIEMGDIKSPTVTLDEIFHYLAHADKPCIVAIDEFQTIAHYPEANVEALLRTYMQHCTNATFVYAGSQRHLMGEIFTSPARPFYQSTAIMELRPIPLSSYTSRLPMPRLMDGRSPFGKTA